MGANRSRNERFRESFLQICDKGGCLEFSLAPADGTNADPHRAPDLVWRVRLLQVTDTELVVERPSAAGRSFSIPENASLVGVMVIGQNRWMFKTKTLNRATTPTRNSTGQQHDVLAGCLRVEMPDHVERCTRREFNRVSIAELHLPNVEVWPLLEPSSVIAAEEANRAMMHSLERSGKIATLSTNDANDLALPVVGPKFHARLMNLGGGGLGLLVDKSESQAATRAKLVWMKLDLRPGLAAPLGLTAKIVHTHIDSTQNLYAGVSFEFAFHQSHREFVIEQIERYIANLQTPKRAAA